MLGLTQLGAVHTLLSLVAIAFGVLAFVRYGSVTIASGTGRWYVAMTALTCLTALPLSRTGQLGPGHTFAVVALALLAFAAVLEVRTFMGSMSRAVAAVSYTATFLLLVIAGIGESTTRLPPAAPLASGFNDPLVLGLVAAAFVGFLIGATVQVRRLRTRSAPAVIMPR